jgi:hypothetical protein
MAVPVRFRRRHTLALVSLALFVLAGAVMSYLFLWRWTNVTAAVEAEAMELLDAAARAAGGGVPYIEIAPGGAVRVHREQESPAGPGFATLTLMDWIPAEGRIIRVDYPRWFVRLKTMSVFNLGTMIAAVRRDWKHIDLRIDYEDLRRRGPGLLLDHRTGAGGRLLLWTSG